MNSKASAARMMSYLTCCKWCLQKRRFLTSGCCRASGSCPVTNRIETVVAEAIHNGSAPLPSRYLQLRAQAIGSMLVRVQAGVAVLPVRIRGKPSKTRNEVNQIARALGMDIWLPR